MANPKGVTIGIVREDPPVSLSVDEEALRTEIQKATLAENAGAWCRVAIFAGESSAYGRRARLMKLEEYPHTQWEFKATKNPGDSGSRLYVRYKGLPSDVDADELNRRRRAGAAAAT